MNQISVLFYSLILIAVSCIIAIILWQIFKRRLTELQTRGDMLDSQLKDAIAARAAAEARSARIPELESQIAQLQCEKGELMKENAALKNQQKADAEKIQWGEKYRDQLKDTFAALSSEALKANSETYYNQAKEQFENILRIVRGDWGTHKEELKGLVGPLENSLKALDEYNKQLEAKREGAYSGIQEQLGQFHSVARELTKALGSPNVRGEWGQTQLRKIVELVGLANHIDFYEQHDTAGGRPDMIINLPNKGILVIDAKTPIKSYSEAMNTDDESERRVKFQELTATMKRTIKDLGNKNYWKEFDRAPEVVVMFIPSDGCIGAAFEQSPDLFDYAVQNNVVITSPFTLYALLKAVAFGWQQHYFLENAREIADQGKKLYDRLATFNSHLGNIRAGLLKAMKSYNDSIGSYNKSVTPAARKFGEIIGSIKELDSPELIEIEQFDIENISADKPPQITDGGDGTSDSESATDG